MNSFSKGFGTKVNETSCIKIGMVRKGFASALYFIKK